MDDVGVKYKQEQWEVEFLFIHLGIATYQKGESPDFTFDYEGKHIGLEHTNCFPNGKTLEHNSWQKIEELIVAELNKSDLQPRLIAYSVTTHKNGKKTYTEIAEEILSAYKWMLDNEVNTIDIYNNYGFPLKALTYIHYSTFYTPDRFSLSEMVGGVGNLAGINHIIDSVSKKEKLLSKYKGKNENSSIQEFWLSIYIPTDEYCTNVECDTTYFNDCQYDRIYLINGRHIGALSRGDTTSIIRLK